MFKIWGLVVQGSAVERQLLAGFCMSNPESNPQEAADYGSMAWLQESLIRMESYSPLK